MHRSSVIIVNKARGDEQLYYNETLLHQRLHLILFCHFILLWLNSLTKETHARFKNNMQSKQLYMIF